MTMSKTEPVTRTKQKEGCSVRVKTRDLTGAALDFAVALARDESVRVERGRVRFALSQFTNDYDLYSPSTDWAQGGPIKTQERISTQIKHDGWWVACIYNMNDDPTYLKLGHSELVAAMRCFCCSRLGDVVDIPEELCQQQNS